MTGFETGAFLTAAPFVVLAILLTLAVTLGVALRVGHHSVIDVTWGLGFVVVAVVTFALSSGHGDAGRRLVATLMVALWGLRLGAHIYRRNHGKGEDPRYVELLAKAPGSPTLYAVRKVYLTQGVVLWFVSLPVQVTQFSHARLGIVAWVGVVVWAVGLYFEAVGDWQLARFKADPANKGTVMDRGLWRYTRHPNYFGDACVWWGVFLVAASAWPGVLTVLSPALMTFTLVRGTGKELLERHMGSRPGFAEYVQRTSGFFPLPPRRAT